MIINLRFTPVLLLLSVLLLSISSYGQQQLAGYKFIENKGQWNSNVKFRADLKCGYLHLEEDRLLYDLYDGKTYDKFVQGHYSKSRIVPTELDFHAYAVNFVDALPSPQMVSEYETPEVYNFFKGKDRSTWAENVSGYHRIRYANLYRGIDLQFYSKAFNLKYDFIVKGGANPNHIRLEYEGMDQLFLRNGKLCVKTSVNTIIEDAPYAYQIVNGEKVEVKCVYQLTENTLSFSFPNGYDSSIELIIDPTLIFSTYSGSTANNFGYSATFDSKGFLYSASSVFNPGVYPTTLGAYSQTFSGGDVDVGLSKFDTTGTFLIWSSLLGGNNTELPHSLIVNNADELFVLGTTSSFNFPTSVGAYDSTYNGGGGLINVANGLGVTYDNGSDIFVARLSSDGGSLDGSTYIGGSHNDGFNFTDDNPALNVLRYNYADEVRGEIEIDEQNNIYVVSCTRSTDFPTTSGAFQENFGGGPLDGCVFKLDNSLSNLIWSSYLGGELHDAGYSLTIDENKDIYLTGGTESTTFPTTPNAIDTSYQGGRADGFVTHITEDGSTIISSTYIGSNTYDQIYFVELDNRGDVYVLGQTEIQDSTFVKNVTWSNFGSGQFISKMTPELDSILYSTVFGSGNGINISPTAFLVDLCSKMYLAGWGGNVNNLTTLNNNAGYTTGMPTTFDAFQSTTDGSDFYIMVLEDDASGLVYGSFFGGPSAAEHVDGGTSRFDRKGKIYQAMCAGCGNFSDMPIEPANAVSDSNRNSCNLGVFKMDFNLPIVLADFETPPLGCAPHSYTFNNTSISQLFTVYEWDFGDGSPVNTSENPSHTYNQPGTYTITLIVSDTATCNFGDTIQKDIIILGDTTYALTGLNICPGDVEQIGLLPSPDTSINYEWISGFNSLSDSLVSNPFANPTVTTTYTLLVSNGICTDTVFQTITVDTPLLTTSGDTVLCNGNNSTTIFANSFGTSSQYIWSSNPGITDTLNTNITSDSLVVSPGIPTTYYVEVNNNGCTTIDSVFVDLASSQMTVSANQFICDGDEIALSVVNGNPADPLTYTWGDDLGVLATGTDTLLVSPSQPTWYYIESVNGAGCVLLDSIFVNVSNLPNETINAYADADTILYFTSVGLHVTPNGYDYSWSPAGDLDDPNSQHPIATPDGTTSEVEYVVTISDGPCTRTDTVRIVLQEFRCEEPYIFVPNAFTPDGSGHNDVLYVRGNYIEEMLFRIYDRWGELVFETTDQSIGWDGTFRGKKVDPAVFDYYLEVTCPGEVTFFKKGNITVIE